MEEINLKELFDYFISKISIIIFITLVVAVLGCSYALFLQKPLYKSSTTIVLTRTDTENSNTITQNDITLNQKLLSTYREIVKSRRVINQVISSLKLKYTYEELNKDISVTSVQDTELIMINVSNENPEQAKKIADETAKVFTSEIQEMYQIKNISIVDNAVVASRPYNINITKQLIIYLFIGAVLGFGVVFVIYYFDTSIKTVEEVENRLELPILGQIPMKPKRRKRA